MSESAGKQGFVDYFVSYLLNFFSKKPNNLNVCIKIDQLTLADGLFLEFCFHVRSDSKIFDYGLKGHCIINFNNLLYYESFVLLLRHDFSCFLREIIFVQP